MKEAIPPKLFKWNIAHFDHNEVQAANEELSSHRVLCYQSLQVLQYLLYQNHTVK